MKMKVNLLVKDKENNIVLSEEYIINDKSDIPKVSSKISERMVYLEKKYPFPEYEVEQQLSIIPPSRKDE